MSLATIVQHVINCPRDLEMEYAKEADAPAEGLAIMLAAIREARAELANLSDVVEHDLLAVMGDKKMTVPGLGEIEAKKTTTYRQWDNDSLWRTVVAYALDERRLDETTGEYESEGAAVARVLGECARPSWRLTPLRARGIDPSEYARVDGESWSVRLPAREIK